MGFFLFLHFPHPTSLSDGLFNAPAGARTQLRTWFIAQPVLIQAGWNHMASTRMIQLLPELLGKGFGGTLARFSPRESGVGTDQNCHEL